MAEQPYADCPQILRDYLFYLLTIKGRSARTVDAYYIDIRTFFRFLVLHKSLGYAICRLKNFRFTLLRLMY